jgi:hypothetical protein
LVRCENQFDNEDNHLLEMAQNFHAAGRDTHFADDKTAKWNVQRRSQTPTLEFNNEPSDRFVRHRFFNFSFFFLNCIPSI